MSPSPLLSAHAVTVRYPHRDRPAIAAVSMSVAPGEVIAIVGHNGAGKTSLCDVLAGVRNPSRGRVELSISPAQLGWSPQRDIIDWSLTGAQNIALPLRVRGLDRRATRAEIARVAHICGIGAVLNQQAQLLSGGQLRRTQIARALAGSPRLLILDEPTTGLDPEAISALYAHLTQQAEQGVSAIVTTHETTRFASCCTRVIALENGALIADENTAEFLSRAPGTEDLWAAYQGYRRSL